jgi:hypothetical protein
MIIIKFCMLKSHFDILEAGLILFFLTAMTLLVTVNFMWLNYLDCVSDPTKLLKCILAGY